VMRRFIALTPMRAQAVDDLARRIVRTIVDRNNFVIGIVELQQGRQRRLDMLGFVSRGNDDAYAGQSTVKIRGPHSAFFWRGGDFRRDIIFSRADISDALAI